MDAHAFLKSLAIVLCTAGLTTVLFQRLRQPVVLGYILAGLIVGPHVPFPLVADQHIVETLSELGVTLLMFSLGLEFSLRKLVEVAPIAGLTAMIQSSIMLWLGFIAAQAFGWTARESLFTGAIIAISSTTIIAKVFDERGIGGRLRELVVGILIVEDLIAVLLMAVLTALSTGEDVSAGTLAMSSGRLAAFLVGVIVVGMLLVPRMVRAITRLGRPETTLVASMGICFAISLCAVEFGYSVALGAFIAGSLVAESGEAKTIEHLVRPVRDMFAAIFFVSVGMLIDPTLVARYWLPVVVLTLVVIVGKVLGVSLGAFLTGNGVRTSVQAGMSLAQIGEFSFIIAALGLSLRATGDFLYPIAVAVSALTTLTTPWLVGSAVPAAAWVDRKLPRPLQTYTALYGSWLEQIRSADRAKTSATATRRLVKLLVLDAALLFAVAVGTSLRLDAMIDLLTASFGLTQAVARLAVVLGALLLATPFVVGILRIARRLGTLLAESAWPTAGADRVDPAAAPRRALVVTLQLAIVLLVGLPLLALTQPFLLGWQAGLGLFVLVATLGVVFWRSAANLDGHVRAGSRMIAEVLAMQAAKGGAGAGEGALVQVQQLLPGLGEPVSLRLEPDDHGVGKTIAELRIRGLSGATVLAILRGKDGMIVPSADEVLRAEDVLALAGTREAVAAAKELIADGPRG